MKYVFATALLLIVLMTSVISCSKCKICTQKSRLEVRICEEDYANDIQYGMMIDSVVTAGYKCQ